MEPRDKDRLLPERTQAGLGRVHLVPYDSSAVAAFKFDVPVNWLWSS